MTLLNSGSVTGRLRLAAPDELAGRSNHELLLKISRMYATQGVLSQRTAPALHDRCPDAGACWKSVRPAARPRGGENWGFARDQAGSIVWPWIGRDYRAGGVAVAGLNLRTNWSETSVALEYMIATNDREQFLLGRSRSTWGSDFAYRSMCAAAAIVTSRAGTKPEVAPTPESLTAVMDQVARVQLVKCNPNSDVVDRGTPSQTMCERCPDRFLLPELRVLKPGVLVMFGLDAFRAMNDRRDVRWRSMRDYLCRGTFALNGRELELFWLPHPSGSQWTYGYRSLLRSLSRRRIENS